MTNEEKTLLGELKSTWESFKELHERHEVEQTKLGEASAETKEALERSNERLDEIEVRLEKMSLDTDRDPERESESKKAFLSWCRKGQVSTEEAKALTVDDETAGGFLAPDEFVREIIKGEVLFSPLREVARIRTTSNRSTQFPKRTGTFAAQWVGEREERTESTGLKYGLEEIPNHELSAKVIISLQDLEDSAFALESEITGEASEQFGVAEGLAFVKGSAIKRPEGFITNADVDLVNSGDASLLKANGILDLSAALKSAYARNATWLLNRKTLYAIRKLTDSNGQFLWQPGLQGGSPALIDGMPYVEMPDMADVAANAKPLALGDWRRGYIIVDRLVMTSQRDPYSDGDNGNVIFRFRKRVGGQVVLPEAIKIQKVAA